MGNGMACTTPKPKANHVKRKKEEEPEKEVEPAINAISIQIPKHSRINLS
jgi:hypothetical protein